MNIIKYLKKTNILCLFIAFINIVILQFLTEVYCADFSAIQKTIFYLSKICSGIIIILFWQFISHYIQKIKQKNKKYIEFSKYVFFYFMLNVIIFICVYPLAHSFFDIPDMIEKFKVYELHPFINLGYSIYCILVYNIVPSLQGVIILSLFLFSLIFSYIIYNIKNNISYGMYKLTIIPFCLPVFLVFNQIPRVNIFAAWMFLLLFSIILFNSNKKINNNIFAILFSVFSAYCLNLRAEFVIFTVMIVLCILLLKVFSFKKYILYLLFFIAFFSIFNYMQSQMLGKYFYKVENYLSAYISLKDANLIKSKEIQENLNYLYTKHRYNSNLDIMERKKCVNIMEKLIFQNCWKLFLRNKLIYLNNIKNKEVSDFLQIYLLVDYKDLEKYSLKDKFVSLFIYGNLKRNINNFTVILYNVFLYCILLVIVFIGGLYTKKYIYPVFSLLLFGILLISTIISVRETYINFIYYYIYWFNSVILFFIFITENIKVNTNKLNSVIY